MHFDADGYLEAFRPPTIAVGGRTFTGRILAADEAFVFEERLQQLRAEPPEGTRRDEKNEYAQVRSLLTDLARALYPRPRWQFWRRPVWWHVERMPLALQLRLFTDFSMCLARLLTVSPALGTSSPETSETGSAPPSVT